MLLTIIIATLVIGGILGASASDNGEKGAGALSGALAALGIVGSLLVRLFFVGLAIFIALALFKAIFC